MKLKLDFLGKDSVKYRDEIDIPDFVGEALNEILKSKKDNDKVFSVGEQDVNEFLRECLPYCTAKLFRTAYGTKLLAEELQAHPTNENMTAEQKKAVYNNAALAVSKKLNHQRNVSKTFDGQMDKINDRIKKVQEELEVKKTETKDKISKVNTDIEKNKSLISDFKKKLEKTDDKVLIKGYKDSIKSKKEVIKKLEEKIEKLKESLKKKSEQLEKLKAMKSFKKETKNIAINTAKTNYSSPKIAFSFCKANNIPISTVYSKALAEKFDWAEDVEEDYYMNFPNND